MSQGPIRVVIADDEPDLRLLLRLQLSTLPDFDVVGEAEDGQVAVDMVAAGDPPIDAIVMDLLMPGTNGFQAIGMLQEAASSVGVVAYTAVAGTFVREEMQRLGVPLVLKSGDVRPLAEALRAVVGRADR